MATTAAGAPRAQTLRDLAEEGKKRAVLLLVFAFGLAFLMSLTSSSVWFNLPCATALIVLFRYVSLDYDLRRKSTTTTDHASHSLVKTKSTEVKEVLHQTEKDAKSDWRSKVNSPPVEAAFEQFTRHLITEWVTDLWYSRVTPDKQGPEELITIVNTVLGEISVRARNVNLINLLIRDLVDLICNNLELYHFCQAKIGREKFVNLTSERRDAELRMILLAENKLHPALFSADAEYKVLKSLADGLISITVKPQDLQCIFFRCTARELLACTVLRPVVNLANPRFINERVESLALLHAKKLEKGVAESLEDATTVKHREPHMPSIDEFSALVDHSSPGVELVRFHQGQSKSASDIQPSRSTNPYSLKSESSHSSSISSSHPLESTSLASSSHIASDNGFSLHTKSSNRETTDGHGRERAQPLGISSEQTHQALALEHLENMWTKGKNYKSENAKSVAKVSVGSASLGSTLVQQSVRSNSERQVASSQLQDQHLQRHSTKPTYTYPKGNLNSLSAEMAEHAGLEEFGVESESSYATEDDEFNNVTGLDSPVTRVWESKSKGNATLSHIHHPLESPGFPRAKKNRSHVGKLKMSRTSSGRKRSRSNAQKPPIWQEVERSSFSVDDGMDILNTSTNDSKTDELDEDPKVESMSRMFSSTNASTLSLPSSDSSYASNYSGANVLQDSYLKLRCEVVGASIVKSGSGMFAVYSISVTDANGNSWSIKRRFRHFEELHRRLKEYSQYNLHLPPKHFLSSGLEVPVVRERCKLLDIYLKNLLQIPIVSSCIEVWDFLSVDSQTYIFTDSLSVIQTLSVSLDERSNGKNIKALYSSGALNGNFISGGQSLHGHIDDTVHKASDIAAGDGLRFRKGDVNKNLGNSVSHTTDSVIYTTANHYQDNSGSDPEQNDHSFSIDSVNPKKLRSIETNDTSQISESDGFSVSPNDWMPPNLSVPLFHLVDVVFQLQDGGWIRRQAFWVAKQILQLGMGDTFDDWLVDKIQLLRKGRIIAFAVQRVEQILWPDGIFMTKHPKRKTSSPPPGAQSNDMGNYLSDEQRIEAAHRANFVRELIIDKAPSPLVSLVGRKDYERCAQDIYFFLQSPVCLKQLAFELLELLVLSAFPELDGTVRTWHENKQQFCTQ